MVIGYLLCLFLANSLLFWGGWSGGWVVRKVKNKDHLSPAEAEIEAELGKKITSPSFELYMSYLCTTKSLTNDLCHSHIS